MRPRRSKKTVFKKVKSGMERKGIDAKMSKMAPRIEMPRMRRKILLPSPTNCFFKMIEKTRKRRMTKAAMSKKKLKSICLLLAFILQETDEKDIFFDVRAFSSANSAFFLDGARTKNSPRKGGWIIIVSID